MVQLTIHFNGESDGSVCVTGDLDDQHFEHYASAQAIESVQQKVSALAGVDTTDRELPAQIGKELRDTFLKPIYEGMANALPLGKGRFLIVSEQPEYLRLPWELLPAPEGDFLVATGRWNILRSTRKTLLPPAAGLNSLPLRIVFCACEPIDLAAIDYEQEEAAVVRLAHQLRGKVHIEIAESGTFAEVCKLVTELKPQIIHLSGHSLLKGRMGCFAFEDERGVSDVRGSPVIADRMFSGQGVRIVVVTGDPSSQAGAAALGEVWTSTNQVPIAITWNKRMAEEPVRRFVHRFLHELVQGHNVESSVNAAREEMNQHSSGTQGVGSHEPGFAWQQIYAAEDEVYLTDQSRKDEAPVRPLIRYELLGDNICGLADGFVGRRRLLQRTGPSLRNGEKQVLLLTGISGSGRSTLAVRLASSLTQHGFQVAPVQAQPNETSQFRLRLLGRLAQACERLDCENDKRALSDGKRPVADRLGVAVEVLNQAKIVLVLDNLEELLPLPPEAPVWKEAEMATFFLELIARLKGEGRVILTCNRVPEGFDLNQKNLAHEPLPDFTVVDFFKYLHRNEGVMKQIERGVLSYELAATFHQKLGITPRFVKQAGAILTKINSAKVNALLEIVPEGLSAEEQQAHFRDRFLAELYESLTAEFRLALSRVALVEVPLPLDGVARVSGLDARQAQKAVLDWFASGLVLEFRGEKAIPLISVHPLQREFFIDPARLPAEHAKAGHAAAASFFRDCFELNREGEMRWSVTAGLVACLRHATFASDEQLRRWAAVRLSRRLQGTADDRTLRELIEPLVREAEQQAQGSLINPP